MPNPGAQLNQVFTALSDPTRRSVVARLGRGPASVTELARPHHMALPSFTQHLKVLERAGLVSSRKRGRVRTYRLQPQRLELVRSWLDEQRAIWEQRLDQLDDYLRELDAAETKEN